MTAPTVTRRHAPGDPAEYIDRARQLRRHWGGTRPANCLHPLAVGACALEPDHTSDQHIAIQIDQRTKTYVVVAVADVQPAPAPATAD